MVKLEVLQNYQARLLLHTIELVFEVPQMSGRSYSPKFVPRWGASMRSVPPSG